MHSNSKPLSIDWSNRYDSPEVFVGHWRIVIDLDNTSHVVKEYKALAGILHLYDILDFEALQKTRESKIFYRDRPIQFPKDSGATAFTKVIVADNILPLFLLDENYEVIL